MVVVLVSTATRAASTLAPLHVAHVPPLVLLVDDPHAVWTAAARRAGVRAVLDRDATVEEITTAVAAAAAGLIVLHPDVFVTPVGTMAGEAGEERTLTPRELEILEMMAEGLSNETIGRRLAISAYTVKFHVGSILGKLRAGSRTEAVTLGVRRGLISL